MSSTLDKYLENIFLSISIIRRENPTYFCTSSNDGKFITVESRASSVFLTVPFYHCPSISEMSTVSFIWKFSGAETTPVLEAAKSQSILFFPFQSSLLLWVDLFFVEILFPGYLFYWWMSYCLLSHVCLILSLLVGNRGRLPAEILCFTSLDFFLGQS